MQLLNKSDVFRTGDSHSKKKWRKRSYPQNHEIQCKIRQTMKSCFHWRLHFHDVWSALVCNCWCIRRAIKNQSLNQTLCRYHFFQYASFAWMNLLSGEIWCWTKYLYKIGRLYKHAQPANFLAPQRAVESSIQTWNKIRNPKGKSGASKRRH